MCSFFYLASTYFLLVLAVYCLKSSVQGTVEQREGEKGEIHKISKCNPYRGLLYSLLDILSVLVTCKLHVCEICLLAKVCL